MDKKDVLLQKSYEILVGLIESENAEEFVEESYAEIEDIIGFIAEELDK